MARCGAAHPDTPERICIVSGTHGNHQDRIGIWPNEEYRAVVAERQVLTRSRTKAAKATKSVAANILRERNHPTTGVPVEAREKWDREGWVQRAEQVTLDFLRTRTEPFTTAEHLWPLLDRPEEMRALSLVIQRFLRQRAIEEAGATRLRGVYRTKDGHEFAENKLVPIYRSLLTLTKETP